MLDASGAADETRPLNAASAMLIRGALRHKFDLTLLLICCIFVHPAHGASDDVANPSKIPLERKGSADDVRTQEEFIYQVRTCKYAYTLRVLCY